MQIIKSPIFATIVNILIILCTLFCLIFVSVDISVILFITSIILFIIFLIIHVYFRNWRFILLNLTIFSVSIFGIYKYLDWATLRMYQPHHLENGDLIFQTSTSSQSKAIQAATNSKYSHIGIIYIEENEYFVYEASSIVKLTPLNDWINNGLDGKYVVKRIKDSELILTPDVLKKMKNVGEKYKGKGCDMYFEWSDEKLYCSELVWKMYKQATNIELGSLEKLSDFDLKKKEVQNQLNERYKGKIPYNELVISPAKMFEYDRLITIEEN
jgi:hypothetical protein